MLFVACSKHENVRNLTTGKVDTINVDVFSEEPNDLTLYMDTLIPIPLETTEASLFGTIDKEGLEESEALRQSILKQAFEGRILGNAELEACKKEPDWEPAEMLLARIEHSRNEGIINRKKAKA